MQWLRLVMERAIVTIPLKCISLLHDSLEGRTYPHKSTNFVTPISPLSSNILLLKVGRQGYFRDLDFPLL